MLKLIVATIINCVYYYIIFVAVKHIYDVSIILSYLGFGSNALGN